MVVGMERGCNSSKLTTGEGRRLDFQCPVLGCRNEISHCLTFEGKGGVELRKEFVECMWVTKSQQCECAIVHTTIRPDIGSMKKRTMQVRGFSLNRPGADRSLKWVTFAEFQADVAFTDGKNWLGIC